MSSLRQCWWEPGRSPAPSVIPVAPFPTPKASVHCKSKTSRNRGVRAEMGDPAEVRARSSVPWVRLQSAGQVQPATYSRMPLPWLSELRRQIWDLPDGRIIFASAILCVCMRVECLGVGAKMGMESRAGSASARAGWLQPGPVPLGGNLRAAPPQAAGGAPPPPPVQAVRGPEAQMRGARGGARESAALGGETGAGELEEKGQRGGWGGLRRRR